MGFSVKNKIIQGQGTQTIHKCEKSVSGVRPVRPQTQKKISYTVTGRRQKTAQLHTGCELHLNLLLVMLGFILGPDKQKRQEVWDRHMWYLY